MSEKGPVKNRIDDVIELLKAKNDTARFAGLLLVTKTLRPDDDDARWMVLDAVGPEFLLRLLLPLKHGRVHPKPLREDEVEHQIALACLGLSVVSNLCLCDRVARCEVLKQPVSRIALDILKDGGIRSLVAHYVQQEAVSVPQNINSKALKDACDCLTAFIQQHSDVMDDMQRNRVFAILSKELSKEYGTVTSQNTEMEKEYVQSLFKCAHACMLRGNCEKMADEVRATLLPTLARYLGSVRLVRADGGSPETHNEKFSNKEDNIEYQLAALHCLSLAFGRFEAGWTKTRESSEAPAWPSDMLSGLEVLLSSSTPVNEKYESYAVLTAMIDELGVAWLVQELDFFELVSLLVRIEIELLVIDAMSSQSRVKMRSNLEIFGPRSTEIVSDQGVAGDLEGQTDQSIQGLDEHIKSLNLRERKEPNAMKDIEVSSGERATQYLPVCLSVFGQLVDALCYAAERDPHESKAVKILHTVAASADLLLQFLEDVSSHEHMDEAQQMLFTLCLGALGKFLTQNPLQFADRCITILPDMLKNGPDACNTLGLLMPFILGVVIPNYVTSDCNDAKLKLQLSKQLLDPNVLPCVMALLSEHIGRLNDSIYNSSEYSEHEHPATMLLYLCLEALATVNCKTIHVSPICDVLTSEDMRDIMERLDDSIHRDGIASHMDFLAASIGVLARVQLASIDAKEASYNGNVAALLKSWIQQYLPSIVQHILDLNDIAPQGEEDDITCSLSEIEDSMFSSLAQLCSQDCPKSPRDIPIEPWCMPLSELVQMFS
ncbi:hypothetical protein M9434_001159 [Picochlorum sp. BPE23]|nr:hypothetical protein M9434_001159 [Picochlorum sp. BPE23]